MIDIHSHILSEVDDGAKSLEMSLEMLRISEEIGMKGIVATPHFFRGRFNFEYNEILGHVEKLKKEARNNGIGIEIYAGQEVYYTEKILSYYLDKMIGTINNSRYMLIELPMLEFDIREVLNTIYELQIRGIVPIMAHPERYRMFIKKPQLINEFIKEGFLFQVNSGSLSGYFGKDVKNTANIFMQNNIYNFIASDAHRSGTSARNTDMRDGVKTLDLNTKKLFEESSEKIINNEEIEFQGQLIKEKKKLFGIW